MDRKLPEGNNDENDENSSRIVDWSTGCSLENIYPLGDSHFKNQPWIPKGSRGQGKVYGTFRDKWGFRSTSLIH